MAQPTPGPWRIYKEFNVMGGADGRRMVANAGGTVDGRLPDGGDGENRANTHLIAAALDLLLAVKAARRIIIAAVTLGVDLPDFDPAQHSVVRQIDAAIAKAETGINAPAHD